MRLIRTALLGLVAVALSLPSASAGRELRMGAKDIPSKIRQAAEGAVPGIVLDAVKIERTKDGIVYEVGGAADGKRYEIEVSREGNVLEVEEDDGVVLSDVPEAAKKAALKALPGSRLIDADAVPGKAGSPAFLLELVKDGKEYEVLVTAAGEVKRVREESKDDDD